MSLCSVIEGKVALTGLDSFLVRFFLIHSPCLTAADTFVPESPCSQLEKSTINHRERKTFPIVDCILKGFEGKHQTVIRDKENPGLLPFAKREGK